MKLGVASLLACLALAAPASALDVGVTEDAGILDPAFVYGTMQDLGMTTNVLSIRWDPANPTAMPANFRWIREAVAAANARGIKVILATYQERARGITDTPDGARVFASWLEDVARQCPACVRRVVVLNEPNQPRFFQPIFDSSCRPAAPAAYAQALAAAYDALKAVDPSIRVYGIGLSPRGNDMCGARSNVSLSPVAFLAALGEAYRAMGRSAPLMDALSFHPYPNVNTDAPAKGYQWPNVGVPNLDRLKQAFEDAFGGTGQPTFASGLTVAIDELGWQADTSAAAGYHGAENVPTVDEATQAAYYAEVVGRFACDPSVESVNFFHLIDEADRDRFQSGILRADRSRRAAYDAVKSASRACAGTPVSWRPARGVVGARNVMGAQGRSSFKRTAWGFNVYAQEDTTYVAQILPAKSRKPVVSTGGEAKAYYTPLVRFPKRRLKPGSYVYRVVLAAKTNPRRTTVFQSKPFRVG